MSLMSMRADPIDNFPDDYLGRDPNGSINNNHSQEFGQSGSFNVPPPTSSLELMADESNN